jgi:GMP reductase
MRINNEIKLDFDDVLLVPQRTKTASRQNINLIRNFNFYNSSSFWTGVPIFAANMDTTGTLAMSDVLNKFQMPTCLHKYYANNKLIEEVNDIDYQWFSLGIKDNDLDRLKIFVDSTNEIPNICIDVANGYTDDFVEFCARIRSIFGKEPIIMAGNVCTPEMVQEIILHGGVDIVKVGIGPGSACTTRLKTSIGYPQLSAIIECSHAAHGLKSGDGKLGLICADGGCKIPADIVKAFAAGADFVMLGGMLAGTDECEGEWEYDDLISGNSIEKRKKCLKFYGMSSHKAQGKYGGIKNYRSSEGRELTIPYKGPVEKIVLDILGGIRSACAYTGSSSLKDLSKTANFIRVNRTHFDQSV